MIEVVPDPRTDSIRGGTVRRVEKPQGSRYLAPRETQVIHWNLCGLGTRTGLRHEVGLEPLSETVTLAERICAGVTHGNRDDQTRFACRTAID